MSTAARKLLIDTDPGVDDAMAIFYALACPEFEVLGLTTIFGNAHTPTCTTNALRLLEIAGRSDIPVAEGAHRPLAMDFRGPADFVHGTDGQGNVHLPPPTTRALDVDAARFLIDTVRAHPGEITLVPLGPLTNVALAMLLDPGFTANLAGIVLMGGAAFVPGNASPAAEANIINDPEAADIVFGADCPVAMLGLDVTEQTTMTAAQVEALAEVDNPRAQHIAAITRFYVDFYRTRAGLDGLHVHDSSTISYLLAPHLYTTRSAPIRVDTTEGISRGKTWPAVRLADNESPWAKRHPVTICTGVDADAVIAMELERLHRP